MLISHNRSGDGGVRALLPTARIEHGWVVMAKDFEHKYVAIVAVIIGGVIVLLGLGGLFLGLL